jgi:hypothetical protein
MIEKYLKSHQYYVDLYDHGTVEICRRLDKQSKDEFENEELKKNKITKRQAKVIEKYAKEWLVHINAGERYLNKEAIIREWMDRDQKKDELYESSQAPEDIRCLTCRNRLKPTFKQLWSESNKEDRILFMYDCPNKCLPHRAFFSDGEEWRIKPHLCVRCNSPVVQSSEDDGIKITTTSSCKKCGHIEIEEYVWKFKKEDDEIDENFAVDRDRFCLTDEEGKKFQEEKWNMQQVGKFMEEWKEKEKIKEEKLKQNPKGFHLEGVGYTCFICGEHTSEGDNWYDQWGIKCLVCQKAIDEGEIPTALAKYKDTWYTKHDLEYYFNVDRFGLKKWIKNGIVRPRIISHYGKGEHTQIFLMRDNKNFFPPKKLLEGHSVKTKEKDDKEYTYIEKWYKFVDPYKYLRKYRIMRYLRVVPPEEMKAREEAEKKKQEEKQALRGQKRLIRKKNGRKK